MLEGDITISILLAILAACVYGAMRLSFIDIKEPRGKLIVKIIIVLVYVWFVSEYMLSLSNEFDIVPHRYR